ncbi:MAG: hypothetical protein IKC35_03720 [Clostridia bacterium]|nr:hypothetical protein [Clostridia bacterium]
MQFIKKLVILTGRASRGTLIVEKNGYGVRCKLNLFDLSDGKYRLVVISGDELFVMNVSPPSVEFELGEINYGEIHAAIIDESVIMYGSNCAKKLSSQYILSKALAHEKMIDNQAASVTYSSSNQTIDDYFHKIAPQKYNDFAIAEKNYFPAYVTLSDDKDGRIEDEPMLKTDDISVMEKAPIDKAKSIDVGQKKEELIKGEKQGMMPYQLERRYLSLMQVAATTAPQPKTRERIEKIENDSDYLGKKIQSMIGDSKRSAKPSLKECCIEGVKPCGRQATYLEKSYTQLQKLLRENERYYEIEELIPGSKFVKIRYDERRFYVVGILGNDYICYGVPGAYSPHAPEPLKGYARWLPRQASNPLSSGFWMMYQDAITGETLKGDF